jgi:hypothetical protein
MSLPQADNRSGLIDTVSRSKGLVRPFVKGDGSAQAVAIAVGPAHRRSPVPGQIRVHQARQLCPVVCWVGGLGGHRVAGLPRAANNAARSACAAAAAEQ